MKRGAVADPSILFQHHDVVKEVFTCLFARCNDSVQRVFLLCRGFRVH